MGDQLSLWLGYCGRAGDNPAPSKASPARKYQLPLAVSTNIYLNKHMFLTPCPFILRYHSTTVHILDYS